MEFDEVQEGEYRIFVGALDAPGAQGFIAAAVVSKTLGGGLSPQEIWRDDSMACGYRWPSAEAAMSYAIHRARDVIRKGQTGAHTSHGSNGGSGGAGSGNPGPAPGASEQAPSGTLRTAAGHRRPTAGGANSSRRVADLSPLLRLRAA